MRFEKQDKIRESEVEEALVSNLFQLGRLLGVSQEIRLIARQLRLDSGDERLDLLVAHGSELCLVELKVTKFRYEFINKIDSYRKQLLKLQDQDELVKGNIRSFLLVTEFTQTDKGQCESNGIELVQYEPTEVLYAYFQRLSDIANFLKIKPRDYGVFNIGLINRVLVQLASGTVSRKALARATRLSEISVDHHLRVAIEFGLVRERNRQYFVTDFGDKFVAQGEGGVRIGELSTAQSDLLKDFIAENPFYSSTIFGIYAIVESAFLLSRNYYPVDFGDLKRMFRIVSGKMSNWQAEKSISTATYSFLNFAVDLGLLGKIGRQILITPSGFRFILMLQLHKSIEMIESLPT